MGAESERVAAERLAADRVAAAARRLARAGLVIGTAGNVSMRCGDRFLITAAGSRLAQVSAANLVRCDLDGSVRDHAGACPRPNPVFRDVDGVDHDSCVQHHPGDGPPPRVRHAGPAPAPSSELRIHVGAYRRPGIGAIVHTHPLVATALSTVVDELPVDPDALPGLGSAIPVVGDAAPGSHHLAELVLAALTGPGAVLMAHHGAIVFAAELDEAVRTSIAIEQAAERQWAAMVAARPARGPLARLAGAGAR